LEWPLSSERSCDGRQADQEIAVFAAKVGDHVVGKRKHPDFSSKGFFMPKIIGAER
jgi:hypothetical protein